MRDRRRWLGRVRIRVLRLRGGEASAPCLLPVCRRWAWRDGLWTLCLGLLVLALARMAGAPPPFPAPRPASAAGSGGAAPMLVPAAGGLEVIFVQQPAGQAVLVRTGEETAVLASGSASLGATVLQLLARLGVQRLQAVVLVTGSRQDPQAAQALIRALPVGQLWESGALPHRVVAAGLLAAARERGVAVRAAWRGSVLPLGAAQLQWLWPPAGLGQPGEEPAGPALVRVAWGKVGILLASAIDPAVQDAVLRLNGSLASQVLQAPDPAAAGSLTPAFLHAVAPRVVLLPDNSAHPPDPALLEQLLGAGAAIVRLGWDEPLAVLTDGQHLAFTLPAEAAPPDGPAAAAQAP